MHKKIIVIAILIVILSLGIAVFTLTRKNNTYDDYLGNEEYSVDVVRIDASDTEDTGDNSEFRYSHSAELLKEILLKEGTSEYKIEYVEKAGKTFIYYVVVNDKLYYIAENEDGGLYQIEDVLTVDEVLDGLIDESINNQAE